MRVLLVEDVDAIRDLRTDVLRQDHGHEVAAFASAEDALDAWTAWRAAGAPPEQGFPLALLDWMLPGMTGLELCQRLRADGGRDTVILVVTARSRPSDLQEVLAAGADDYLAKPFVLELFDVRLAVAARRVDEVAARVRAEREAEERARLEGALLAARTAAHELNNALSLPVGYAELLLLHPTITADPNLQSKVQQILEQTEHAASVVRQLQRVVRLERIPAPGDIGIDLLDLRRSAGGEGASPGSASTD